MARHKVCATDALNVPLQVDLIPEMRNGELSSTVVAAWVSDTENAEWEVLVYALLDTQSDTTFILQQTEGCWEEVENQSN